MEKFRNAWFFVLKFRSSFYFGQLKTDNLRNDDAEVRSLLNDWTFIGFEKADRHEHEGVMNHKGNPATAQE